MLQTLAIGSSLSVSNLPLDMSRVELEAMVWTAGRIIDSFMPIVQRIGKKKGFGFVRFKIEKEALCAIDLARGRSWGGRKISASFARPRILINQLSPPSPPKEVLDARHLDWVTRDAASPTQHRSRPSASWIVKDGSTQVLRWPLGSLKRKREACGSAWWVF